MGRNPILDFYSALIEDPEAIRIIELVVGDETSEEIVADLLVGKGNDD